MLIAPGENIENKTIYLKINQFQFNEQLKIAAEQAKNISKINEKTLEIDGKKLIVREILDGKFKGRMITENGNIFALKGKKYVKHHRRASGLAYFQIMINTIIEEENVYITVARTFLKNDNNYNHVIHIDKNISNNHYTNLKWAEFPDEPEKFKVIPMFSNYKVAKDSTVQSYFNDKPFVMKPYKNEKGYMTIKIVADDGFAYNMYIHRIVALTYLVNPLNLPQVDHIDRIKENNNLENLKWVTSSENNKNKKYERSIVQYDSNGKFICNFRNATEAVLKLKLTIFADMLIECANENKIKDLENKNNIVRYGYIWKYKKPELFVFQEKEIAVNLVKDFGFKKIDFPNYYITNFGNIFNNKGYKKSVCNEDICPSISLTNRDKNETFDVHQLVGLFFVEGRTDEKCITDHLDEDRKNPRFDNLEWITYAENAKRAAHKSFKAVNKIDPKTGEIIKTYESMISAAKEINPENADNIVSGISKCCHGLQNTSMKFKWEFVNKGHLKK